MPRDIYKELLEPSGISAARNAIIDAYRGNWFTHWSRIDGFKSVMRLGLQPHYPSPARVPEEVRERMGCRSRLILCFWPPGSPFLVFGDGHHRFRLALRAEDLPFQLGLDWSHESWSIAGERHAGFPSWDNNKIFVNVVGGTGSLVSYDPVATSFLRVCPRGARDSDPSAWPMLRQVTAADIELFS
jgi:hypothetical protein